MFSALDQFLLYNASISSASIKDYMWNIANRVSIFEAKSCQLKIDPTEIQLLFQALSTNQNLVKLCIENCSQNVQINDLVTEMLL